MSQIFDKGTFILVPDKEALRGRPPLEQLVAIWIGDYGLTNAFPSRKTIARDCGVSVKSIDRAIAKVEQDGIIIKRRRKNQNGGDTSNSYSRIMRGDIGAGASDKNDTGASDKNDTGASDKNDTLTTPNIELTQNELTKLTNTYVPPATQAPLPQEALDLADLLKEKILKNQPTAKIDENYQKNWAKDIEKAHRIDGRSWSQLRGAITYAQDYSDFWGVNIRSGAKLRKHYDRLEADLRRDFNRRGTMILPNPQNAYNEPLDDLTPPF